MIGSLIGLLSQAAIVAVIAYAVWRMLRPRVVNEENAFSADVPDDHVQLAVICANKAWLRSAKVLLDGAEVGWQKTDKRMTCRTVTGSHRLFAKAGFRSNEWTINCPENGLYEIQLLADRLMGGFQNEVKVVKNNALTLKQTSPQPHEINATAQGRDTGLTLTCAICTAAIKDFHYGFEHIVMAPGLGLQCASCGTAWCQTHEDGNYTEPSPGKLQCKKCGGACAMLEGGPASRSMVSKAKREGAYGQFVRPPEENSRATEA